MIDAHNALREYLIATSGLRTLLGGNYVYTPELPSSRSGDTMNVVFSVTGGQTYPNLRAQNLRVAFRCYGESSEEAREVERALYDRLHDTQNFLVGDVGFHGAVQEVPGVPMEDSGTDWPFIFTVYSIRVATIPVGDGGS